MCRDKASNKGRPLWALHSELRFIHQISLSWFGIPWAVFKRFGWEHDINFATNQLSDSSKWQLCTSRPKKPAQTLASLSSLPPLCSSPCILPSTLYNPAAAHHAAFCSLSSTSCHSNHNYCLLSHSCTPLQSLEFLTDATLLFQLLFKFLNNLIGCTYMIRCAMHCF